MLELCAVSISQAQNEKHVQNRKKAENISKITPTIKFETIFLIENAEERRGKLRMGVFLKLKTMV